MNHPLRDSTGGLAVPLRGGEWAWVAACLLGIAVAHPWPRPRASWGALLRTPVPFLAQEVFEVVDELLRVPVVLTPWAWRRGTRRVIGLL